MKAFQVSVGKKSLERAIRELRRLVNLDGTLKQLKNRANNPKKSDRRKGKARMAIDREKAAEKKRKKRAKYLKLQEERRWK